MLYLARKLHLPSGEVLERYVVTVRDEKVLRWQPFEAESHSMSLVDELLVGENSSGELIVKSIRF